VSDLAHQEGHQVVFQSTEDRAGETAYAGLLREQHVDGLIVSGPRCDDAQLSRLHEEGYPLVLHGHLPDCTTPFVDVDNVGGAYKAVSHLIGLGYRRIGFDHQRPSLIYGRPRQTDGLPSSLGFDDIFFAAYVSPPLTTVRLPAYGLGWTAGESLIRLTNEDELAETQMLLESELGYGSLVEETVPLRMKCVEFTGSSYLRLCK